MRLTVRATADTQISQAAGVSGLIKVLMMLQERMIPPQPDLPFKINHRFPDLAKMNVHIAGTDMKLRSSPIDDGKLRVFLNSFDASVRSLLSSVINR